MRYPYATVGQFYYGTPSRIRTYVFWFRARCPWPLDDGGMFDTPGGIRTLRLLVQSQLSLAAGRQGYFWWTREDLNPHSSPCKGDAFPFLLRARWYLIWTAEGFEPSTLWLLAKCSSRLSYAPILCLKDCRGNRTHLLKGHNRLCVAITLCSPY